MKKMLLALLIVTPALAMSQPRVFTATYVQSLSVPEALANDMPSIAIDGDSIIVAAQNNAYLYRRAANGGWNYSGLFLANGKAPEMKNGFAVLRQGNSAVIYEKVGGKYVQSPLPQPITATAGFSISGKRILVSSDGCGEDVRLYEKNSAGAWQVMGRIPADASLCGLDSVRFELNYDTVVMNSYSVDTRTYHRNGSAFDWVRIGDISAQYAGHASVLNDIAVMDNLSYYRRSGSVWNLAGKLRPLNYAYGAGDYGEPLYRDGVVLVNDGQRDWDNNWEPYVYMKNAQGGFDHVGVVRAPNQVEGFDISGNTVVTTEYEVHDEWYISVNVYQLPAARLRPSAFASSFEDRDASGFTPSAGSQYAIAGNQYNYLYRQSNGTADTASVVASSDWSDYQSVEVELKPNAFLRDNSWAGLAVRYVDADNYYFVTLGNDQVMRLQRKLNGVVTTLAQKSAAVAVGAWQKIRLIADLNGVQVSGSIAGSLSSSDRTLTHGRAALLTSGARADFDNLLVKSTDGFTVFREQPPYLSGQREFTYAGGHWTSTNAGFVQDDTSGQALLVYGPTLQDQAAKTQVHLDSFASTNPVAWYGVLARYVDPGNYYYLSLRSSGTLQIRKVVNGVATVLKAVNFTPLPTPDGSHWLQLDVVGHELTALVDDAVAARAVDDQIPAGRAGIGTYRAAASFEVFTADQL